MLAASSFLICGAAANIVALLIAGAMLVALVASAYMLAIVRLWSIESGVLRVDFVDVSPGDPGAVVRVHQGDRVPIAIRVQNVAPIGYARLELEPMTPTGIAFETPTIRLGLVLPNTQVTAPIAAIAARTGRWAVHGIFVGAEDTLGLARVATYVARPKIVDVLPTTKHTPHPASVALRPRVARARAGAHRSRRAGDGTDLREVREYVQGDPLSKVAWAATARTRKLMVREHEREDAGSVFIVLDVSATMRGGDNGSKFEHALGIVYGALGALISRGDAVGLLSFDDRVLGRFRPKTSAVHMRRIVQHLRHIANHPDSAHSAYDDAQLVGRAVHYLLVQERLDFRAKTGGPWLEENHDLVDFNLPLLARWIRQEAKRIQESTGAPTLDAETDLASVHWLAFACGIEIPYRTDVSVGLKERALAGAMREAIVRQRTPVRIVVISDLCAILDAADVAEAVREGRARRHQVAFIVPFTPGYVTPGKRSGDGVDDLVHETFARSEHRVRLRMAKTLRTAGATVTFVGPDVAPDQVWQGIQEHRRRR